MASERKDAPKASEKSKQAHERRGKAHEHLAATLAPALEAAEALMNELGLHDSTLDYPVAERVWNAGVEVIRAESNKPQAYATLLAWATVLTNEYRRVQEALEASPLSGADIDAPLRSEEDALRRELVAAAGKIGRDARVLLLLLRASLTSPSVGKWKEHFSDEAIVGGRLAGSDENHAMDFLMGFVEWSKRYGSPDEMIEKYELHGKRGGSKGALIAGIIRHIPPERAGPLEGDVDDKIQPKRVATALQRLLPPVFDDGGPVYPTRTDTAEIVRRLWRLAWCWEFIRESDPTYEFDGEDFGELEERAERLQALRDSNVNVKDERSPSLKPLPPPNSTA